MVPFRRDYGPRTNIHSRLTPLFTDGCFPPPTTPVPSPSPRSSLRSCIFLFRPWWLFAAHRAIFPLAPSRSKPSSSRLDYRHTDNGASEERKRTGEKKGQEILSRGLRRPGFSVHGASTQVGDYPSSSRSSLSEPHLPRSAAARNCPGRPSKDEITKRPRSTKTRLTSPSGTRRARRIKPARPRIEHLFKGCRQPLERNRRTRFSVATQKRRTNRTRISRAPEQLESRNVRSRVKNLFLSRPCEGIYESELDRNSNTRSPATIVGSLLFSTRCIHRDARTLMHSPLP